MATNPLISEIAIVIYIIIILAIMYKVTQYFYKRKDHIWYEPKQIPKSEKDQKYSLDIVIFDIETEKEYEGYFDNERQRYYSYNDSLVLGKFRWRYL
jgi:hypothetical protein